MLHALPALLDDLERRLIQGEDPLPLLSTVRWAEVIDWPQTMEGAQRLKQRLAGLQQLLNGLQAPLNAALSAAGANPSYQASGRVELSPHFTLGIQEHV